MCIPLLSEMETKKKKIRVKDVSLDNHFSYRNGKIVYASYQPDKRSGNRDYSNLQILDVKSAAQKTVTHHSKYFAPDINNDGTRIVAVQVSPRGNSILHLINTHDGSIEKAVPNPGNLFYTYPKFYGDKIISAVKNQKGEMSLVIIDPSTGNADPVPPTLLTRWASPYIRGYGLFFCIKRGRG